jgi:hypothetical protein
MVALEDETYNPSQPSTSPTLVVTTTGLSPEEKDEVVRLTARLGGNFADDFTTATTHLVARAVGSAKYGVACQMGVAVVFPDWLRACASAGALVDVGPHALAPFAGLRVAITGERFVRAVRDSMCAVLEAAGATVCASLDETVSHLLSDGSATAKLRAVRAEPAFRHIKVVTEAWVHACVGARRWLSETTSTPPGALFLDACRVLLLGLSESERSEAVRALRVGGATRYPRYCDECTHCVLGSAEPHTLSAGDRAVVDALRAAQSDPSSARLVGIGWLRACVFAGALLAADTPGAQPPAVRSAAAQPEARAGKENSGRTHSRALAAASEPRVEARLEARFDQVAASAPADAPRAGADPQLARRALRPSGAEGRGGGESIVDSACATSHGAAAAGGGALSGYALILSGRQGAWPAEGTDARELLLSTLRSLGTGALFFDEVSSQGRARWLQQAEPPPDGGKRALRILCHHGSECLKAASELAWSARRLGLVADMVSPDWVQDAQSQRSAVRASLASKKPDVRAAGRARASADARRARLRLRRARARLGAPPPPSPATELRARACPMPSVCVRARSLPSLPGCVPVRASGLVSGGV